MNISSSKVCETSYVASYVASVSSVAAAGGLANALKEALTQVKLIPRKLVLLQKYPLYTAPRAALTHTADLCTRRCSKKTEKNVSWIQYLLPLTLL
jgi:hypothetical protein